MPKKVKIEDLMAQSRVKFGTSGARGLVSDMTDEVCYAYTQGFLQYLEQIGELSGVGTVGIGGDLRPSTDRIILAVARAVQDRGYTPNNCGKLPSPALAFYGLEKSIPTIMVTGSHIPEDRNGIKYTKREGEILKPDEAGIRDQEVSIPDDLFDLEQGMLRVPPRPLPATSEASDVYVYRYLEFFPSGCMQGKRIGVYQHSAVGRDLMIRIYTELGAEVIPLDRADHFVPVDTEALRPEDVEKAEKWAGEHRFDAIVSSDGDSDRPLVGDEKGKWLRGDVAGILTAAYFKADTVVVPVSCNSAVEKCGWFKQVTRTRIGSPYVIEAMQIARDEGAKRVVGYEANGGFLLASPVGAFNRVLGPLPTRDAVIVHIAVILQSALKKVPVSALVDELPRRFTYSDRLKNFPTARSRSRIEELWSADRPEDTQAIQQVFSGEFGKVKGVDSTDGLRITFESDEVVHLRPSGNAPEFRCYTEADSEERARKINQTCIGIMETWR